MLGVTAFAAEVTRVGDGDGDVALGDAAGALGFWRALGLRDPWAAAASPRARWLGWTANGRVGCVRRRLLGAGAAAGTADSDRSVSDGGLWLDSKGARPPTRGGGSGLATLMAATARKRRGSFESRACRVCVCAISWATQRINREAFAKFVDIREPELQVAAAEQPRSRARSAVDTRACNAGAGVARHPLRPQALDRGAPPPAQARRAAAAAGHESRDR